LREIFHETQGEASEATEKREVQEREKRKYGILVVALMPVLRRL
jgi:hypothetical protein